MLAFALATSKATLASSKEASSPRSDIIQFQLMQQALIIELHPKIMSVLRQKYHDNFSFGNAHVLPIQGADILEFEFVLEGIIMKREQPEQFK
jgi:hypothetical protein